MPTASRLFFMVQMMNEQHDIHGKGAFKLKLAIVASYMILVPWFVIWLIGTHNFEPHIIALISGIAIVGAAFLMAWAAEAGQFVFSQAFALAILALLQVAPEYSFEAVLAWQRRIHLAAATMTGANRLLMGLGWPLIVFIAYISSKIRGDSDPVTEVELDVSQSVEIGFLVWCTIYSFVIVAKGTLDVIDVAVLVSTYVFYLIFCIKMPAEEVSEMEEIHGPAKLLLGLKGYLKAVGIFIFFLAGGLVIITAAEPFINSIIAVAIMAGISAFFFAQWVAPLLSEFPESTSAFYYATSKKLAPMGIGNLVSSKVNQWSLLIGTVPLVYSLSVGHLAFIPLTPLQREEILLTGAQSLFGVVALMKLRFTIKDALLLFGLWLIQFVYPPIRIEITVAYIVLALIEFIYYRHENVKLFKEFARAWRLAFGKKK